jgi:LysR family transcriptional regulator, hydrogen peroxide-inducible genes activator
LDAPLNVGRLSLSLSFTLTQLNYLLALNETRHFGLAARKLHVSQPTLSLQIQKLEEDLGASLFDRSKSPIVPTEIGELIVGQARKVLGEARQLETILAGDIEVQGSFRVGIIPTLSADILPRFVPELLRNFPKVQLSVEEVITEEIVERLKRDELDAGILVTPLNDSGLQEFPLFYEPLWVYLPEKHSLLKEKVLSPTDLQREGLLLLTEGHCFRSQMLEVCRQRRSKKHEHTQFQFDSGSFEALVTLVDEGVGYTIIPQLAVDRLLSKSSRHKRLRPFQEPEPVREVSLVRSRLFSKKLIADQIAHMIQARMKTELKVKPAKHSILPLVPKNIPRSI